MANRSSRRSAGCDKTEDSPYAEDDDGEATTEKLRNVAGDSAASDLGTGGNVVDQSSTRTIRTL